MKSIRSKTDKLVRELFETPSYPAFVRQKVAGTIHIVTKPGGFDYPEVLNGLYSRAPDPVKSVCPHLYGSASVLRKNAATVPAHSGNIRDLLMERAGVAEAIAAVLLRGDRGELVILHTRMGEAERQLIQAVASCGDIVPTSVPVGSALVGRVSAVIFRPHALLKGERGSHEWIRGVYHTSAAVAEADGLGPGDTLAGVLFI